MAYTCQIVLAVLLVLKGSAVFYQGILDTQERGAVDSQGQLTGSQSVGGGRAVSSGVHSGSQAVGHGRATISLHSTREHDQLWAQTQCCC